MLDYAAAFAAALPYDEFLRQHGSEVHAGRWQACYDRTHLTEEQNTLLAGFTREMNLLVMAGAWCGDCADQCPIFERFAEASPLVNVRYLDRDLHADKHDKLLVCGGRRVPTVVFLSEEFKEVGRMGDSTLARYRHKAAGLAQLSGGACSTGLVAPAADLQAAVVQEWLNELERCQLILRLSPSLRAKHGD